MDNSLRIHLNSALLIVFSAVAAFGQEPPAPSESRFTRTDRLVKAARDGLTQFKNVVVIDHARLAAKEGVTMPPAVVTICSDASVNTSLVADNVRTGIDLPFRILAFEGPRGSRVSWVTSSFLSRRHGVRNAVALQAYDRALEAGLSGIDPGYFEPETGKNIARDFGIIQLQSDYSPRETIQRLKTIVTGQEDTVWFGQIDYQNEAAELGVQIRPATLLLFGAPKPGGVAMTAFPKLGLDAFCQKLLVYEDEDQRVIVIFNNIVELAKLHYGKSAPPHAMIDGRLKKTFESAIRRSEQ